jgi:hypothetical protein
MIADSVFGMTPGLFYGNWDDVKTAPSFTSHAARSEERVFPSEVIFEGSSSSPVVYVCYTEGARDSAYLNAFLQGNQMGLGIGAVIAPAARPRKALGYNKWFKKIIGLDSVDMADSSSTALSPKASAKLHIYNMLQYEAVRSRGEALEYMFDFLEQSFEHKEVEMLNLLLYTAARDLRTSSLGVSLLRGTFRAKKDLTMWAVCRDAMYSSMQSSPDSKKLFRGLLG